MKSAEMYAKEEDNEAQTNRMGEYPKGGRVMTRLLHMVGSIQKQKGEGS